MQKLVKKISDEKDASAASLFDLPFSTGNFTNFDFDFTGLNSDQTLHGFLKTQPWVGGPGLDTNAPVSKKAKKAAAPSSSVKKLVKKRGRPCKVSQ